MTKSSRDGRDQDVRTKMYVAGSPPRLPRGSTCDFREWPAGSVSTAYLLPASDAINSLDVPFLCEKVLILVEIPTLLYPFGWGTDSDLSTDL